jgi:hypothetical protein
MTGLQQHIIEGECVESGWRFNDASHGQIPSRKKNAFHPVRIVRTGGVHEFMEVGEGW